MRDTRYRSAIYYLGWLLLFTVIAYWPVSCYVLSLKNDALNYFLPVRRLVSEAYYYRSLPAWTPYLNLGYPLHGDMQSGVWNPFVQLFSLFGPYRLYTLHLETLLYIFLSGAGMFFLLRHFRVHPTANMIASTAFMLCGFNSDSCQFLNWISGTAFLPFVFLFYWRCLKEASVRQGIYTAIALYFLFNCAYPADFIITGYLMLGLFIASVVQFYRAHAFQPIKKILLAHLLLVVVFILLSAPAIISYYTCLPLSERGSGASYYEVMSNPLHPYLTSSYITPLAIWHMPGIGITDPLERNSYIGIVGLFVLLLAFSSRTTSPLAKLCKWCILIFLLFSFGELGGLRILAYYALPLMDSFRHPANAKMFTLFFSCLLIGLTFHQLQLQPVKTGLLKKVFTVLLVLILVMLGVAFISGFNLFSASGFAAIFSRNSGSGIFMRVKEMLTSLSFGDLIVLNILLQVPFIYFIHRYLLKAFRPARLLSVAVINCILFTLLFQPFTVVKNTRAAAIQQMVDRVTVTGYPVPAIHKTIAENGIGNEDQILDIGCRNLYSKQIGRSDYRITPSNLLVQNEFWFDTSFRERMLQHPLIYRPATIFPVAMKGPAAISTTGMIGFLPTVTAPLTQKGSSSFSFLSFSPNRWEIATDTDTTGYCVIMQNHHPRWRLEIDGKPAPLYKANVAFIGFRLPGGSHKVTLTYYTGDIKIAWLVSFLTVLSLMLLFLFPKKK